MARVLLPGPIREFTKVIMLMIRKKDMVSSYGLMEEYIRVIGATVSSMEWGK